MIRSFDDPAVDLFPRSEATSLDLLVSAVAGGLVGGACGDALGWVTEFMRSRSSIQKQLGIDQVTDFVAWRKNVGGRFNTYIDYIGPGEYSDDTQLTLAVARSLTSPEPVEYFAKQELVAWLDYSRGAGRAITAAAKNLTLGKTQWFLNFFDKGGVSYLQAGGNGAAMRASPLAFAALKANAPPLGAAFANSISTHGHPRAHLGAMAYVVAIWEAYHRKGREKGARVYLDAVLQWLRQWRPEAVSQGELAAWVQRWERSGRSYVSAWNESLDEFSSMLDVIGHHDTDAVLRTLGCYQPATKGSGIGTVAAALHLFCWHGKNIERAVVAAANAVPADTDTIAAMVGTLSGVYGGMEGVPQRWSRKLQDLPYFLWLAEGIARFAEGREVELRPKLLRSDSHYLPHIVQALSSDEISVAQRVRHYIFGAGIVQAVHAQQIKRKGGGQVVYARVVFDMGQTCQFKVYRAAKQTKVPVRE